MLIVFSRLIEGDVIYSHKLSYSLKSLVFIALKLRKGLSCFNEQCQVVAMETSHYPKIMQQNSKILPWNYSENMCYCFLQDLKICHPCHFTLIKWCPWYLYRHINFHFTYANCQFMWAYLEIWSISCKGFALNFWKIREKH